MPGRPVRARSPLLSIADEAVRALTPFADYDQYQDENINGDWFNRKEDYRAWRNYGVKRAHCSEAPKATRAPSAEKDGDQKSSRNSCDRPRRSSPNE